MRANHSINRDANLHHWCTLEGSQNWTTRGSRGLVFNMQGTNYSQVQTASGQGVALTGANTYIKSTINEAFHPTEFTVEILFQYTSVTTTEAFLMEQELFNDYNHAFGLIVTNVNRMQYRIGAGSGLGHLPGTGTNNLPSNRPILVQHSYKQNQGRIAYVNGIIDMDNSATFALNYTGNTTVNPWTIGARPSGSTNFSGLVVMDWKVWDVGMTKQELQARFNKRKHLL